MSVTIDDWCIGWWKKALLTVEAVTFVIRVWTYLEGGLILGHPTHHFPVATSLLPRPLVFAQVVTYCHWLKFCWRRFDLKLKLLFFETLLLSFFRPFHYHYWSFCRLAACLDPQGILNAWGFWRCSRYWGIILSWRTAFLWCLTLLTLVFEGPVTWPQINCNLT